MVCPICLDDFGTQNGDVYVTDCNHLFHKRCFVKLETVYETTEVSCFTCPMCRTMTHMPVMEERCFSYKAVPKAKLDTVFEVLFDEILDKADTFFAGAFAATLFAALTNKPRLVHETVIDVYRPAPAECHSHDDMDDNVDSEWCTLSKNVAGVQHKSTSDNNVSYRLIDIHASVLYDIRSVVEDTFRSFDLSCCKVAFVLETDCIRFFIHRDYYAGIVKVCAKRFEQTCARMKQFIDRGYTFERQVSCCGHDYDSD